MKGNFPHLVKEIDIQVQEAQTIPDKLDPKRATLRHVIVKMPKVKNKESFKKRFHLFIFRQRGREREREGEKYQCVVACHRPPTGDLACNPWVCPDWESNRRPFGSQAGVQSTEPHQPGLFFLIWRKLDAQATSKLT